MITVEIKPDGLTIDGHAGYAKSGNDILCAAVSMLAQNLVNSMEALTEDRPECHVWDGHMDIAWKNLSSQGALLVDSFFIGICSLAGTYGNDFIRIN